MADRLNAAQIEKRRARLAERVRRREELLERRADKLRDYKRSRMRQPMRSAGELAQQEAAVENGQHVGTPSAGGGA